MKIYSDILANEHAGSFSKRQQLFLRNTFAVLVDLVVLGLFNQYWDLVYIESFSIMALTAILLQTLLKASIAVEHYVAGFFKKMSGTKAKVMRALSTWAILFVSKLIILKVIDMIFHESVHFGGEHHVITFIVVIVAIIAAEQLFLVIYNWLGNKDIEQPE